MDMLPRIKALGLRTLGCVVKSCRLKGFEIQWWHGSLAHIFKPIVPSLIVSPESIEYGFAYIITRSPYTPYSTYLRGTITLEPVSLHDAPGLARFKERERSVFKALVNRSSRRVGRAAWQPLPCLAQSPNKTK